MQYLYMFLFVCGIVGIDQWTKVLTVTNIPEYGHAEAIPGLFSLTFAKNTGGAWSMMEGMIWLFVLVFALFAAAMVWEFITHKIGLSTFERWCAVAIFGGGLGNVIDRLRLGYVVDMINLDFMTFPVFNVADCFVTCGCILMMIHLVFFNKSFWKDKE